MLRWYKRRKVTKKNVKVPEVRYTDLKGRHQNWYKKRLSTNMTELIYLIENEHTHKRNKISNYKHLKVAWIDIWVQGAEGKE